MRILELENRCARERTEGSNPSLSAKICHIFSHLVDARAFIELDTKSLEQAFANQLQT
jgi:hypothetical protein